jgi:hypothetical protein
VERQREGAAPSGGTGNQDRWAPEALRAVAILVLAWAGFLLVPDRLLAYLTTRVTPHARDALVAGWVAIYFVVLCWVFVALQRGRRT